MFKIFEKFLPKRDGETVGDCQRELMASFVQIEDALPEWGGAEQASDPLPFSKARAVDVEPDGSILETRESIDFGQSGFEVADDAVPADLDPTELEDQLLDMLEGAEPKAAPSRGRSDGRFTGETNCLIAERFIVTVDRDFYEGRIRDESTPAPLEPLLVEDVLFDDIFAKVSDTDQDHAVTGSRLPKREAFHEIVKQMMADPATRSPAQLERILANPEVVREQLVGSDTVS